MYETPKWAQYVLWAFIALGLLSAAVFAAPICEPDKFLATLKLVDQMDCPKELADGALCLLFVSPDVADVGYVVVVWNKMLIAIIQVKKDGAKEFLYQAIQIEVAPKEVAWKCEGLCA